MEKNKKEQEKTKEESKTLKVLTLRDLETSITGAARRLCGSCGSGGGGGNS